MNKQIFKICPTLGEYHKAAHPFIKSMKEYREFYVQHKEAIDKETRIYSEIQVSRTQLGGDRKIHGVWMK